MKKTLVRIVFVVAFLFPIFGLQAKDTAFRLSGPYVHLNLEIFLVHGEQEAQKHLKGLLEESGFKTTIIRYGERYPLKSA